MDCAVGHARMNFSISLMLMIAFGVECDCDGKVFVGRCRRNWEVRERHLYFAKSDSASSPSAISFEG